MKPTPRVDREVTTEQAKEDFLSVLIGDDPDDHNHIRVCVRHNSVSHLKTRLSTRLKQRQVEIIFLRFGLDNNHPLVFREIGERFGFSDGRAHQIFHHAIRRCRNPIMWGGLRPLGMTSFDGEMWKHEEAR